MDYLFNYHSTSEAWRCRWVYLGLIRVWMLIVDLFLQLFRSGVLASPVKREGGNNSRFFKRSRALMLIIGLFI